jgi:hypothetical protein
MMRRPPISAPVLVAPLLLQSWGSSSWQWLVLETHGRSKGRREHWAELADTLQQRPDKVASFAVLPSLQCFVGAE